MTELATYTSECDRHETVLFMVGNYAAAVSMIQDFCHTTPWCVSVERADYVYTPGVVDAGFVVRAINYARFPDNTNKANFARMQRLAKILQVELEQDSYTIMHGTKSYYFSNSAKDATNG